jgi:hypothetical protein
MLQVRLRVGANLFTCGVAPSILLVGGCSLRVGVVILATTPWLGNKGSRNPPQ